MLDLMWWTEVNSEEDTRLSAAGAVLWPCGLHTVRAELRFLSCDVWKNCFQLQHFESTGTFYFF